MVGNYVNQKGTQTSLLPALTNKPAGTLAGGLGGGLPMQVQKRGLDCAPGDRRYKHVIGL